LRFIFKTPENIGIFGIYEIFLALKDLFGIFSSDLPLAIIQWAKSPKKQSVGVYFRQHGTVF